MNATNLILDRLVSELLNERIDGSKLEWLSAAHPLATLEHPEAFNTMLSKLLAKQSQD